MMPKYIPKLLFFLFILLLPYACSDDSSSPATPDNTGLEKNGGKWKTIVLNSPDDIQLSAPAAAGSNEYKAEINEVISLQAGLSDIQLNEINYWNGKGVIRWNEIARDLVIKYKINPPLATRIYSNLSVAQYDALVTAWNKKYKYNRMAPPTYNSAVAARVQAVKAPAYPSEHSVIASVSKEILTYFFPDEAVFLEEKMTVHQNSRIWAGVNVRSDITAGEMIGIEIAEKVIVRAKGDNSAAQWTGTIPTGDGKWYSSEVPAKPPMLPLWSEVKPWMITSPSTMICPAHPVFNSEEFRAALAEVKYIAGHRTAEQTRIADFWSDGPGTYTPPGHWNLITADLIESQNMNELRAARTFALVNMAMMDGGICWWGAKFKYWLIRPSQADTSISLAVPLPNFPSYSSGHSSFSSSAAYVLAYIFPEKKNELEAIAREASMSRLYGGIHYRFDCDEGLKEEWPELYDGK
ncbi:MAG TPA: vanadium-dependent haloperoxidase, partial [Ignavibacteriales bacterium]|nr:vanadium-dependent haloperoxidase [Ignavibacteriales bacterium]